MGGIAMQSAAVPPSIRRELLRLAVPSAAFVLLTNAYRVVDQYWVDAISVAAQAAVGSTMFVLVVAYASFEVLSAGCGPLMARATGARDDARRRAAFGQALFGALVLAAAWAALGGLGAETVAGSLGLEDAARTEAARYLAALSVTSLPLVLTPVLDQAFLAMGNARAPLILHGVALAGNLVLTPLFVVGFDWGVVGAALASNLSRAVSSGWGLIYLSRELELRPSDLRPGGLLLRTARIGLPMASSTALYGFAYWALLYAAVSPLGPEVNAALGIGWSALEGLSWPTFHGVGLAVASMVGRRLGARDLEGALEAAKEGLRPTIVIGLFVSVVFIVFARPLCAIFASDPVVLEEAVLYARIIGVSQLFVALESTAEGVLAGAGDTRAIFMTSAPLNLLRIPLAWALAFPVGLGSAGIWWAMSATTVVKCGLKLALMLRGRWTTLELG